MTSDHADREQESAEIDAEPPCYHVLVSTVDPTVGPVVFFPYPISLQTQRECPPGYEVRLVPVSKSGVRIGFAFVKRYMYNAMRQAFKAANLKKLSAASHTGPDWNIFWGDHLKSSEFASLKPTSKHSQAYSGIIPETYLTGNEYERQQFLLRYRANPHVLWILKPPNLSCGRGIKIVSAASTQSPKLTKKRAYVAQRYVANPFLINELKFDLRIYVLVTSYDPLRVYLYDNGLVRFCTEKYSVSKDGLKNQFGHLTNYSVNKKNSAAFQPNQDNGNVDDTFASSKWSLQSLCKYLLDRGKQRDLQEIQQALEDLIVKTFIAVESKVLMMSTTSGPSGCNGFELYGFDILLEGEEMKPWLLEVNVFPSLSSSSPMDKRIKTMLVSDVFQLVGVPFLDAAAVVGQIEKEKKDRLLGTQRKKSAVGVQSNKLTVEDLVEEGISPGDLSSTDLRIVKELEVEDARRGHFKRIFPITDSWSRYGSLFETQRYKNVLCMRWLEALAQNRRRRASAPNNKAHAVG